MTPWTVGVELQFFHPRLRGCRKHHGHPRVSVAVVIVVVLVVVVGCIMVTGDINFINVVMAKFFTDDASHSGTW